MALNAGASSNVPSLRMATPLVVPFSNSSKLDCVQRWVPSATAKVASSANPSVRRIAFFIGRTQLSQTARSCGEALPVLRLHRGQQLHTKDTKEKPTKLTEERPSPRALGSLSAIPLIPVGTPLFVSAP